MKNCLFTLLSFVAITGLAVPAHAEVAPDAMGWTLPAFEVSALNAMQGSGNTTSGMAAWTPRYRIDSQFAVRANLGVSALLGKNSHGRDMTFAMIDAEVLGRIRLFDRFEAELGGGLQDWDNQGGVAGAVSVNFGYDPGPAWLGFIDRVFVGYTNVFLDENVNELRAGFGLAF